MPLLRARQRLLLPRLSARLGDPLDLLILLRVAAIRFAYSAGGAAAAHTWQRVNAARNASSISGTLILRGIVMQAAERDINAKQVSCDVKSNQCQ